MNNMMNMFMNFFGKDFNPMQFMGAQSNNPIMQYCLKITEGKTPEQIQEIIKNVANQKGINSNQLTQMFNQFKQFKF